MRQTVTASPATTPPRRPAAALCPVTVTAPPLFGAAAGGHLAERDPPEAPPVDQVPIWWPLALVVVLAAVAVAVAPAGAVVLP